MSVWLVVGVVLAVAVVLGGVTVAVLLVRGRRRVAGPPADAGPDPGPEGTYRDLRAVTGPATGPRAVRGALPPDLAAPVGGLALLQLSSQFCADCRASRAVLTDVAAEHPGVQIREVDVALRPELVRLLGIRRTPTTLVVDPAGIELARIAGIPRRADLSAAVGGRPSAGPPMRPTG